MIKAIIFDCFGVLATDNWQAFVDSLPPDADTEHARSAHRAYDAGQISKTVAAQQIKEATGKVFTELDDMSEAPAKNMELLRYAAHLRKHGYKLSILSNVASNWLRETFLEPEEQQLFDDFVLSYETGMVKPDARMFSLAAERLGVELNEAVLVDDKESYCVAAQNLGMNTVTYKSFGQMKRDLEKLLQNQQ